MRHSFRAVKRTTRVPRVTVVRPPNPDYPPEICLELPSGQLWLEPSEATIIADALRAAVTEARS